MAERAIDNREAVGSTPTPWTNLQAGVAKRKGTRLPTWQFVGSMPTARSSSIVLCRLRTADKLLNARTTMNFERSERTPETILRLREVLQRTGLSRSTLYNRIAKRQFPHQVSLGGRAVGWVRGEVEDWIIERTLLRPELATSISEDGPPEGLAIPKSIRGGRQEMQRSTEPTRYTITSDNKSPNPAQLDLVSTKIYYDKGTGSFWLKLLPEDPARGR